MEVCPPTAGQEHLPLKHQFEASLKTKRAERGQTIEGTIVAIGPEVAFIGGKGEATIEVAELKDDDGDTEVAVGDRIQAVVLSTAGGLTLSRSLARGAATQRQLEDAFHSGLPVEGRIEKEVKGGYEVRIGGQRAFCPFSQIDTARGTDPATHIGKVYTFPITEYKEGGRNLVVSRRTLLRISDPSQVLKPGEETTVKVLQVDDAKQKISLGLKQLTEDPWSTVQTTYEVGQVLTARVTRVTEFGAFIELAPGVEALAHVSTFAPTGRSHEWKALVAPGMTAAFEILSIDLGKKRIGVALVPADLHPSLTNSMAH